MLVIDRRHKSLSCSAGPQWRCLIRRRRAPLFQPFRNPRTRQEQPPGDEDKSNERQVIAHPPDCCVDPRSMSFFLNGDLRLYSSFVTCIRSHSANLSRSRLRYRSTAHCPTAGDRHVIRPRCVRSTGMLLLAAPTWQPRRRLHFLRGIDSAI